MLQPNMCSSFFQLRKYAIPLVMKEQKGLTPMILAGENINN
jgi:hypothetical protein